jgi:hypothetical protein
MTQMFGKYRGVVKGHEPEPELGQLKPTMK